MNLFDALEARKGVAAQWKEMLPDHVSILLVEDDSDDARLVKLFLNEALSLAFSLNCVPNLASALDCLATSTVDLVLLDLSLPDSTGIDTVTSILDAAPEATVIVLTAHGDQDLAIRALQSGAQDFVIKGQHDGYVLARVVLFSLSRKQLLLEQSRVSDQLRRSEERYKELVENQGEGVGLVDPSERFVFANPAAHEIFGVPAGELVGRSLDDFVDAAGRGTIRLETRNRRDGARSSYELGIQGEDGVPRILLVTATPRVERDGSVSGTLGIFRDITELKGAEEALRKSERRYRNLFERNLAGVYRSTLDGRIVDCNQAFAQIVGCESCDEVIARPAHAFHPKSSTRDRLAGTLAEHGELRNQEIELLRVDGTPVRVLANISLVKDDENGGQLAEGTVIDITDYKRMEEQLRHAQKMEAVGRLAGGVAHDFNNVLQAIAGLSYNLDLVAENPEVARDVGSELAKAVQRGAQLTRQLLLFSRREQPEPEVFELNGLICGSQRMLARLLRENITFELDLCPSDLPILADRGQIEQVVTNLVVNAQDAMPSGGVLTIRSMAVNGTSIAFEVQDTGEGIPKNIRDRIFEPFFTTKESGRGTGLGLAVVHGIVTQADGTIDVESVIENGTIFRIVLPRHLGDVSFSAASQEIDHNLEGGDGERVLVVEDEDGVREGLRQALTMLGYESDEAASVQDAIRSISQNRFDLVLSDMVLPDGTGVEVRDFVGRECPLTRVILMSGYSEEAVSQEEIENGSVHFLQKPFSIARLAREIRVSLDRTSGGDA